jgi:SAM-dependent methyltransferase
MRSVLDLGAGDGYFARRLLDAMPRDATVVCCDPNYSDDDKARSTPRLRFVGAPPEERFDAVVALDVMEHVPDDARFARTLYERAGAGAAVLVSVPAWPALYTSRDRALGHFRRYAPKEAAGVLKGAGLRVRDHGGLFSSLLAVRAVERVLHGASAPATGGEALPAPDDLSWSGPAALSEAVARVLGLESRVEGWLARRGVRPPGLSWWALCERPS